MAMREVSTTDAKAHLAELLRTVERGESISITRHGRAVAHLVPAGDRDRVIRQQAMDRFMEMRSTWKRTGMTKQEVLAARHVGHRL